MWMVTTIAQVTKNPFQNPPRWDEGGAYGPRWASSWRRWARALIQ